MKIPMMLASTSRRIFASRSSRSRYSRVFSSEIAACDASSFSTATRAGVKTCERQVVLEVEHADQLGLLSSGRQRMDRARR